MMNAMYGFERECTSKYSKTMFHTFSDFFNTMPLGHIINGKVLVVHGGLFSDQTVTIDSIQKMNRIGQPPESGPLNDILWSDPMEEKGLAPSPRGVTRTFGPDITEQFLERNNLELLIRSHQVQENGYGVMHGGKCITVFSAPNYIGQMGNRGAIVKLSFSDDLKLQKTEYEQFTAQPIPPNYMPMKYANLGSFF
ncbi:protein phsophatase-2A [Tritrichomonas foetus]|uniref:Protein phsophatase-2A n=1 Tax=Tritrichomonas foetus TaxID=1144522 RepID=A0A1J4JH07_9EUKA|nr:protein phsophatase-2A [Tritrichomonas foetus]|eukprot:OHS98442.1 protein phsophatase-2A [Tritrichomonas foetus]